MIHIMTFNTLTVSAILGQTRLPLLSHKSQILSKNKVHLQPKKTVLFPFTRWQHVYYILNTSLTVNMLKQHDFGFKRSKIKVVRLESGRAQTALLESLTTFSSK